MIGEDDIAPYYFFDLEVTERGSFNLNIDLPFDSADSFENNLRFSPIKYFMTRLNEQE